MIDKLNKHFEGKRILVLGLGREGKSTISFLQKYFPKVKYDKADKKFGDKYLDNLKNYDLVIKSPGISWNIKQIADAKRKGIKFTSQTQLFLELFRDKTIGITGTKGKSTTASLVYNILKTANIEAELIGNIGKPVLDYVNENSCRKWFVFEMSSHQTSDLSISPHIAVLLNIYPEHLDYYKDFNEYFEAKAGIVKNQKPFDIFIYNNDFEEITKLASKIISKKYPFSENEDLEDYKIDVKHNPLLGVHNLNNIKAAVLVSKTLDVDRQYIEKGIETFSPIVDRLELVKQLNGIKFINDGLATIPEATISAIKSFPNEKLTLILGGFDRNLSFDRLGEFISESKNVLNLVLTGQTAGKIKTAVEKFGFKGKIYNLGTSSMNEVVRHSYKITLPQGTILFSPAATSFDMYKDYKDRSNKFKKAVADLNK